MVALAERSQKQVLDRLEQAKSPVRKTKLTKLAFIWFMLVVLLLFIWLLPAILVIEGGDRLKESVGSDAGALIEEVVKGAATDTARKINREAPGRLIPLPH